jgi:hypothetical protein
MGHGKVLLQAVRDLVVVRATHVVAAVRAHQLATVPGEPMPAVGADLAVVIDTGIAAGLGGPCLFARARYTVRGDPCRGIGGEFGIEGARPFRVHARQIKTFLRPLYTENPPVT